MRLLQIALELLFDLGPYLLCAAAGAYLEAKYGANAKVVVAAAKAKLEAEVSALKAKL